MFFLWFWGRLGRSMGWAHMQSAHACAVETHFFVFAFFFKIGSTWFHFDSILEVFFFAQNHNFEWKQSSNKLFKNGDPLDYNPGPALPGSPPRVLQRFLNKKQLSEQEILMIWHALGKARRIWLEGWPPPSRPWPLAMAMASGPWSLVLGL